jgi:hypothetical protein
MRLLALLLVPNLFAAGVELQVQYSAIQKVLSRQMFGDSGRMYVKGSAETRCSFAYLENPVLGAASGRIEIKAHFSGKNATSFFGKCFGFGDTFEMRIMASPYYDGGLIRLKDVDVETAGRDSLYARKVRAAITENLSKRFEYKVADEARRILERPHAGEPYKQQLQNFQVSQIRVTPASLLLTLEFTLVVQ